MCLMNLSFCVCTRAVIVAPYIFWRIFIRTGHDHHSYLLMNVAMPSFFLDHECRNVMASFEAFTEVILQVEVFWNVTPRG